MEYFVDCSFLASFDEGFCASEASTRTEEAEEDCKKRLKKSVKELKGLQEVLYADDRFSVLCIFQAMDAAGKDSTIRAVFSGVNPAGFQVFSFKKPSAEALDHDFLWRSSQCLPERGRIGVFNRSYYEEVLVVRVHPSILESQKVPEELKTDDIWKQRCESICDHELHLSRNGMVILKFFLNVSKEEQKKRFLSRLDEPKKNWKFSTRDVEERKHWDRYMKAYEYVINQTSRPWAPWYVIPADDKKAMRANVSEIIVSTLSKLPMSFPEVSPAQLEEFNAARKGLES